METLPLRLNPGLDLRRALEEAVASRKCQAAFVLSGIGSLTQARLRFAGVTDAQCIAGNLELLSLAGSIRGAGAHLHASIGDRQGNVVGGHLSYGCIVRTTAEVLLALLPGWQFERALDAATGYDELVVRGGQARQCGKPGVPT